MSAERRVGRVTWQGQQRWVAPAPDGRLALLDGDLEGGLSSTGAYVREPEVTFLPPVQPSKIIGIGANFPGDDEGGPRTEPSFFLKAPSAVTAHGSTVTLPRIFASVLAEGELAVVIKARAKNLTPATAAAAILGYSIINDLSGRDSTLAVVPPAAKKSADGFAPLGPWLDLAAELRHFTIRTTRNGEVVQEGSTRDLLFSVVECLCHITSILTLEPSDVVAMGTPPPKPKLVPGDEVSVTLSGLGTLTNRIA